MQRPPEQKNYAQRLAVWVLVFMVGAVLLASTYSMGDASPGTDGGGSASGALAWAGFGVTAIGAVGGLITSYAALKTARHTEQEPAQQQASEPRGPEARWNHAEPLLVDPYAAHAATGIKPGTIRVWLHRGKLTHHGHDHAGHALVDLRELQGHLTTDAA